MSKVFFITGADRTVGAAIAREALAAGHKVVAAGRNSEEVAKALGEPDGTLLVTALDTADLDRARAVAQTAVDRFGRIDVLVNGSSSFFAGYFEEVSPAQLRQQLEVNLFGPINVTRAVLPAMRDQRAGHVMTISSVAGLAGREFCAAYATSKFAVEGWMESLHFDVAPYGIHTTIVEPGFLAASESIYWPELSIHDYSQRTAEQREVWQEQAGSAGDPVKLAKALMAITQQQRPLRRFVAGPDAIPAAEAKAEELLGQAVASRDLGMNLPRAGE